MGSSEISETREASGVHLYEPICRGGKGGQVGALVSMRQGAAGEAVGVAPRSRQART